MAEKDAEEEDDEEEDADAEEDDTVLIPFQAVAAFVGTEVATVKRRS